jgi:hypothetical protein
VRFFLSPLIAAFRSSSSPFVHDGRLTSVRTNTYNNLKLDAGVRKQVGQVCENKLLVSDQQLRLKITF